MNKIIHYVGLDVHKNSIAVARFEWSRAPHVVFGHCPGLDWLRSTRPSSREPEPNANSFLTANGREWDLLFASIGVHSRLPSFRKRGLINRFGGGKWYWHIGFLAANRAAKLGHLSLLAMTDPAMHSFLS
jgi:hypothetical protein